MHCSGFSAKVALHEAFEEGCVPAGVGLKVEVKGDRAAEDKSFLHGFDWKRMESENTMSVFQ